MSTSFGGIPIALRMFQRELRSRESKAALRSIRRRRVVGGTHVVAQLGV